MLVRHLEAEHGDGSSLAVVVLVVAIMMAVWLDGGADSAAQSWCQTVLLSNAASSC